MSDQTLAGKVGSDVRDIENQMWDKINDPATSADVRNALRIEYKEVNHRLLMLIDFKLREETAALRKKADKVRGARDELQAVLNDIQKAINVTNGVTRFLTAVDSFIDAAKPFFV